MRKLNNTKYRNIFAAVAFSMSSVVFGANGDINSGNFDLWATTNGADTIRIVLTGSDSIYNPAVCSDPDSYFIDTSLSAASLSRIYSNLLVAKTNGNKITVTVSSSGCSGVKPKVIDVILK